MNLPIDLDSYKQARIAIYEKEKRELRTPAGKPVRWRLVQLTIPRDCCMKFIAEHPEVIESSAFAARVEWARLMGVNPENVVVEECE